MRAPGCFACELVSCGVERVSRSMRDAGELLADGAADGL